MKVTRLEIPDVVMILPAKITDARGFFSETYNAKALDKICPNLAFVQDNHALSAAPGTVRGLHFQVPPMAQNKLIRVLKGAIFDVAVDLRSNSASFGQHVTSVLSAQNWAQLLVPAGFAHGYCTLEPDTEVFYKVDQFYSREHDKGLAWDDPQLGIDWPADIEPLLSAKDCDQPLLKDLPGFFD